MYLKAIAKLAKASHNISHNIITSAQYTCDTKRKKKHFNDNDNRPENVDCMLF